MFPRLAFLLAAISAASVVAGGGNKISVFLLAGQSNMSGHGGVANNRWDGVVPPSCKPLPGILRLNAVQRWEKAREPLHADIEPHVACGVGPGMPFAHAVLSSGKWAPPLGLVPSAVGGTAIRQWAKGMHLYSNLVSRARAAVQNGGKLQAVLWFQGESDTNEAADAEAYKQRMETLISNLRQDLDDPDLIFIQVAIESGGKYLKEIRSAQKSIKLRNVLCVDANGLPLESDNVHLTTQAQVVLGKMLADAFLHFTAHPLI